MDVASWDVDTWRTFNVGVTGTRSSIQVVRSRADRALKANVLGRKCWPSRWSRLSGSRLSGGWLSRNGLITSKLNRSGLTRSRKRQGRLTGFELDVSLHEADESVQFISERLFRVCYLSVDPTSSAFRVENAFRVALLAFFRLGAIVRELVIRKLGSIDLGVAVVSNHRKLV